MTATPPPLTDEQLAERIAEVIRPRMLIGLQDAELYDGPGTERINEWATSIANWAAEVVRPEVDRLRAERDQARAERDAANARITAVLALTVASREELEQMDPEQYHRAIGCDTAITDIQRMLAARES
jgi:hypothetical protein